MRKTQSANLQQELRNLLRSLQLPDTAFRINAPPVLRRLNLQTARGLLQTCEAWNDRGLFDDSERLIHEVLLKSEETRQAFLASEVDLLQRVADSGEDQLYRGYCGLAELVLPIKVQGHHVHLLRTGKFREEPFSDAELKELAFVSGIARSAVEAAAKAVPIRSGETLAGFLNLHRRLRDALAAALEAQLQLALMGQSAVPADGLTSLGAMAEGAAHQFSNLLSIILGYSSLVLAKTELPTEAIAALNKISEAAQKGRRLTEEMLAVSGAHQEEAVSSSLHDRLNSALATLQANRPQAAAIALDLQAEHDEVPAGPGTLHAVSLNLLRHALEGAMEGANLRVVTRNVIENGVEQIVAEVVEGETRQAREDAPRIVLPVISSPLLKSEKKVRRRLAPSEIWVADDDPAVREMCQRVLTAEGHTVQEASSGEELMARLKAAASPPDLLIYDFSMPDLDGVEFCTQLRQQSIRVPIILISGFNAEHPDLKRMLQLRKVFLLQKPFSYRDMSDLITIAMGETLVE